MATLKLTDSATTLTTKKKHRLFSGNADFSYEDCSEPKPSTSSIDSGLPVNSAIEDCSQPGPSSFDCQMQRQQDKIAANMKHFSKKPSIAAAQTKASGKVPLPSKVPCPICSKSISRTNVGKHQRIHKEKKKPLKRKDAVKPFRFICDEPLCKYETKRQADLQRHKTIHTSERWMANRHRKLDRMLKSVVASMDLLCKYVDTATTKETLKTCVDNYKDIANDFGKIISHLAEKSQPELFKSAVVAAKNKLGTLGAKLEKQTHALSTGVMDVKTLGPLKRFCICDTNVFMKFPMIIDDIIQRDNTEIVLPYVVMIELDQNKTSRYRETQFLARRANDQLATYLEAKQVKYAQSITSYRKFESIASRDDQILAYVQSLKLREDCIPYLITDDKNLTTKSFASKVKIIRAEKYFESDL